MSRQQPLLLIDADIVAFAAASIGQNDHDFGDMVCTALSPEDMEQKIEETIGEYCETLKSNNVLICLSDPRVNWRKAVDPTYKENRANAKRPELLTAAKELIARDWPSAWYPTLEADDVMGIIATREARGETIIVSADKDMRTIPALVYSPNRPEVGVLDITELEAGLFHLWQTVCGDATDGYPGCPGVGPASVYAEEIISADSLDEAWDIVLDAYATKGLDEFAAIHQARLARILRNGEFNPKTHEVTLWNPNMLG
ncbi:MAG: hypothetical protein ACXIUZ_01960 [Lysobacteraceae bacterium]